MAEITDKDLETLVKEQEDNKAKQAEAQALKDEAERKAKIEALTKEETRIRESIESARAERRKKDETFQEKFSREQFEKAKSKFFNDYKYSDPTAQAKVLEVLSRVSSGSVDADNVYKDLEAAHLLLNKDKYINLERDVTKSEAEAAAMAAMASGSGFTGAGEGVKIENVDLSPEDVRAAQWSGMPLEKYRELKAKGKIV